MTPSSEESSLNDPSRSPTQHPKLRRLASKPLKMAQNTLRPLTSRKSSYAPSSVFSSSTIGASTDASTNGSPNSSSGKKMRRHHRLKGQAGLTPAQIASAAKGQRKPLDGEEPVAWLRVRVVRADGLVAKDRRGTSDPYVVSPCFGLEGSYSCGGSEILQADLSVTGSSPSC